MIKVIVASGSEARELVIDDSSVLIGRSAECQIKVDDAKSSRQHAKIEKSGDAYLCSDFDSANGTSVNDVRVTAPVTLRRGDVILIGHTLITLTDMDLPDPPPAPPQPQPQPQAPVAAAAEPAPAARGSGLKRVAVVAMIGAAGVAATVLVMAVISASRKNAPAPVASSGATLQDRELKEADDALQQFREKVAGADFVTDELVDESKKLGAAYNAIHRSRRGNSVAPPFDLMLSSLLTRRAEQQAMQKAALTRTIDELLSQRRYAEAIGALRDFHQKSGPAFEDMIREAIQRIDRVIDEDMARVRSRGESLEGYEQYSEAAAHYQNHLSRFRGTKHETIFIGRPELLGEIARIAATPRKPVPTPTLAPPPVEFIAGLVGLIAPQINLGALSTRTFGFGGELKGCPMAADATGVTVKRDAATAVAPWPSIPPLTMFAMGSLVLKGDDLLRVAEYGYGAGLRFETDRLLWSYAGADASRRSRADLLISKNRKQAVPKGGYSWHPARGWEDPADAESREAETEAWFLCAVLVDPADVKSLAPAVTRLTALLDGGTIAAPAQHRIQAEAVAALKACKAGHVKIIAAKTKGISGDFDKLRAAKRKLTQAREAAIKLIYDESKYLREDHPDWTKGDGPNGQLAVDKLVDEVRKLWDSAGTYVATMDPSLKKEIELVRAINEEHLPALGDPPDEEELKEYEEVMSNLNSRINLKTFCANSSEAKQYEWNRKVDAYNAALKDPAVGDSEKDHAQVVNDYREMMGRRRLFIDAKLCRATRKHSAAQNAAGRIWHVGSDGDPQSRAQAEGFSGGVGENVCLGYPDPVTWTNGWYRASDHHRNGLSDAWTCLGYGYVGNVGSENFSSIGAPF